MVEPISITTGVAGLLGAIATIAVKISSLKQRWDHSELNISMTYSSLFSVKRVLESIQRLRETSYDGSEASQQLDDDLAVPLESCAVLVASLERSMEGIDVENPSRMERGRFLTLKETFEQAERSLDIQLRALQVMLTIYQCEKAEQRERLNRRDTRRMLDRVRQETVSAFQRLEEQDVSDVASMLSREPSIKFPFDYEILQSPMYKRVYHDLYLKYKPESSRGSVAGIPSPRNSISRPPAFPPPPIPLQDATNIPSPRPSTAERERPRDNDANHRLRPASALPYVESHTAQPTATPPGSALLSPETIDQKKHRKRKSASSIQKTEMVLPDIMFLGVPFQGETVASSSEESEVEEETASEEPREDASIPEGFHDHESDLYGVSDDEALEDKKTDGSPKKPSIAIGRVEPESAPPHKVDSSPAAASMETRQSADAIEKTAVDLPDQADAPVSGLYLGNTELQRLQQSIRNQRARAATTSAVTLTPRSSVISKQTEELQRSDSVDSPKQRREEDSPNMQTGTLPDEIPAASDSADISKSSQEEQPSNQQNESSSDQVAAALDSVDSSVVEQDNLQTRRKPFSPKIDIPLLESESSGFKIDFDAPSTSKTSQARTTRELQRPETPLGAPSEASHEDAAPQTAVPTERETSIPTLDLKRQLTIEDAVPPPLIVKKTPPPVPLITPPPVDARSPKPPTREPPVPPQRSPPLLPTSSQSLARPVSASLSPKIAEGSPVPTSVMPPQPRSAPPLPPKPSSFASSPRLPPEETGADADNTMEPIPSTPLYSSPPLPPESLGISLETSPKPPPVPTTRPMRPVSRRAAPEPPSKPREEGDTGKILDTAPKRAPPLPPKRASAASPAPSPHISTSSGTSFSPTMEAPSERPSTSPVHKHGRSMSSSGQSPKPMIASPVDSAAFSMRDDASTVGSTLSESRTSSSYNDTRTLNNTIGTHATTVDDNRSQFEADVAEATRRQAIISSLEKQNKKTNNEAGPMGIAKLRGMSSRASLSKIFTSKEKATRTKILHDAAQRGDTRIVADYLKDNRTAINKLERINETETAKSLFMRAAEGNHLDCMEFLAASGAEFAQTDRDGRAALHHAVQAGCMEATRWLSDHFHLAPQASSGPSPVGPLELADSDGFRPLHIAAGTGNLPIVRLLIERGAYVESTDRYGRTALFPAIVAHKVDTVRLLLDAGANVSREDIDRHTPLMWAAEANSVEAVELLLQRGADRYAVDNQRNNAIHLAARCGALAVVEALYLSLDDLEAGNHIGERAIHLAAAADQAHVVKALLLIGCDPNNITRPNIKRRTLMKNATYKDYGASPLHYACANGSYDPAVHLINHGAKVNAGQDDGTSPLMLAAAFGSAPLCSLLIENEANMQAQTSVDQLTPLHFALIKGDLETTKVLANSGADPKIQNRKKETAWQHATKNGDPSKYNEATKWLMTFETTQRSVLFRANRQQQQQQQQEYLQQANMYAQLGHQWPVYTGYPSNNAPNQSNVRYITPAVPSVPSPGNMIAAAPYWAYTDTGYAVNQNRFYQPPHIEPSQRTDPGIEPPPAYSPPGTRPAQ